MGFSAFPTSSVSLKIRRLLVGGMLLFFANYAQAQSMGVGTNTPAPSAALEVKSTSKGFLPPRMTQAQRDALAAPATGLVIFNTDSHHLNVWDGTRWTSALQDTETPYTPAAQTFNYTGGPQTYAVPYGVTSVTVDAFGASGQAGTANPFPLGGKGARVQATLNVTPGEVLTIYVGGSEPITYFTYQTNHPYPNLEGGGGYNGGGHGKLMSLGGGFCIPPNIYCYTLGYWGGGGGATDIRRGGTTLTHRVIVAGGGGGSVYGVQGGDGGLNGADAQATGQQGMGGTQTAGGLGGTYAYPGTLGRGGNGSSSLGPGGGGGGGYYGGGGGGFANGGGSGGGGGSSYTQPTMTSAVTVTAGVNTGHGRLIITPNPAIQYAAPAISGTNIALPDGANGAVVFSGTPGLKTNGSNLFWDNTNNRLGIGTNGPAFALHTVGSIYTGGSAAELSFQDRSDAAKRFTWYATNDRATLWHNSAGDRLTVTAAGTVGIGVTIPNQTLHVAGRMQLDNGVIQRGGAAITNTNDLGLYQRSPGNWMRFVTNNAPIRFYSDDGIGTNANVTFAANGNVGIGTDIPDARLHVNGGGQMSPSNPIVTYMNRANGFQHNASVGGNNRPVAGYFTGGQVWVNDIIVAGALNVSSDARIKRIVGLSDRAADLALLNRIRITDYTYIDQLANSGQVVKKVIAQEVQALLPAAVTTSTQAIPNVYERATQVVWQAGNVTVTMQKPHGLPATGGRMRFYTTTNTDLNVAVQVLDDHTVRFAAEKPYDELFVYGKYVDDFLSVDYDALTTLNISATQELACQLTELQQRNTELETRLQQLQAQANQSATDHATLLTLQQQLAQLLAEKSTASTR